MTTKVLNGPVAPGDLVAYSVRRHWGMATRIGVVVETLPPVIGVFSNKVIHPGSLKVRAVKSSDKRELQRMVWLTELDRVVKIQAGIQ